MAVIALTINKNEMDENWDIRLCGVGGPPHERYAKYLCHAETDKIVISLYKEGSDRNFTVKELSITKQIYPSLKVMYISEE